MNRWTVIGGALLAAFGTVIAIAQREWLLVGICTLLLCGFLLVLVSPQSMLARAITRVHAPQPKPMESQRRFCLRISGLWAAACVVTLGCFYSIQHFAPASSGYSLPLLALLALFAIAAILKAGAYLASAFRLDATHGA